MIPQPARDQADAVLAALIGALDGTRLIGVYLYGSAVAGGMRPDSDLDLFGVADTRLAPGERIAIVEALLPLSGRDTRPTDWRPVELTTVALSDVRPWRYPPTMDLLFGEWLRPDLLAGRIEPPRPNPDLGVLLTMTRQHSVPLVGPPATEALDPVPHADLVHAMVDSLPSLLDDLSGDTRNVLLTLARMWTTVATGDILPKDAAADWVLERMPEAHRPMLAYARDLYRDGGYGDWPDRDAFETLAGLMADEIRRAA